MIVRSNVKRKAQDYQKPRLENKISPKRKRERMGRIRRRKE